MAAPLRDAFLRACTLDVAVRKPGNVSWASAGHGMQASHFLASAQAAAGPLFEPGAAVGRRIAGAVEATLGVAGCNTNLGILLLCAPIAAAAERHPELAPREALRAVLARLDVADAASAFQAIAQANPGGLGRAEAEDVHQPPSIDLRAAMALAADRDSIARQYRDAYADLFDLGLPALGDGFSAGAATPPEPPVVAAVQRLYLGYLAAVPDSHIVRKRGDAVAQHVLRAAAPWAARARDGEALDADPAFASWDEALKSADINPGTSADLTVATLLLAAWAGGR